MWIKDLQTGTVREYGKNCHDSLRISGDGRTLTYYNLQNGDGSGYGDFRFVVDPEGHTPDEDETLIKYGADVYFNIGGWNVPKWIPVTEMLPQEPEIVLVTCQPKKGAANVNRAYYDRTTGHWHGSGSMSSVTAWMPLPEPYKTEEYR